MTTPLTHPKIPRDILHVGSPKQSRMTFQQAADSFMSAKAFTPTRARFGVFKLHLFPAPAASNRIKSFERQILR
jgi:hypothetical protein